MLPDSNQRMAGREHTPGRSDTAVHVTPSSPLRAPSPHTRSLPLGADTRQVSLFDECRPNGPLTPSRTQRVRGCSLPCGFRSSAAQSVNNEQRRTGADSKAVATFLATFHTQANPSVGGCLCATAHHTLLYRWRSLLVASMLSCRLLAAEILASLLILAVAVAATPWAMRSLLCASR